MATSVTQAFSIFITNEVNLVPDRTTKGRSSRDWLMGQLVSLPAKSADFPRLYEERNIRFGSFARNTKIRPLDDIDLILAFAADGAWYNTIESGKHYTITVPNTTVNLRKLCNENGQLNSIKLVNKVVKSLGNIEHYKEADIHRRQEAATLKLTSYEWNFDIVPAFYTDNGHYLIPDGNGQWKASDPRIDQERTKVVNKLHNGNALQFIRLLKYWKHQTQMPEMSSYLFENILINYLNNRQSIASFSYPPGELRDFWIYLERGIYSSVMDPKGFQGELNTMSYAEHNLISAKAKQMSDLSYEAIMSAVDDAKKSIGIWGKVFGGNFPKYG